MPEETPLESWKEIAGYLQRNVVTVRRWEKEEGLPIRRHSHKIRSSVYAYPNEIDAWRASRKVVAQAASAPVNTFWRVPTFALATLLCLVMVGNGVRPQAASAKDGPLAKRLVCSDCGDSGGNLSQDGRWMVYTDWDTGDLVIRDMKTGKARRLMVKAGDWGNGASAEGPVLSRDNRQIVYDWDAGKGGGSRDQFRVAPNEPGGRSRILVDSPDYKYYEAQAWFPDGKSVLAMIIQQDNTSLLARVSVSDGAVKVLKQLGWRPYREWNVRLSPDGRYIAYSVLAVNPSAWPPPASDPKDVHMYILAADGSSDSEIVKTAGNNQNQFWTPDGRHIMFTSDRTGKTGLWSIAVRDGKAVGEAALVNSDLGHIDAFGMAGGSYLYYQHAQTESIHIARLDGNTSDTQSFTGIRPVWSPDGRFLAFKRHHPESSGAAVVPPYDIVVHSLETGEEKTYFTDVGFSGDGAPYWFHDGKSIMTGIGHGKPGAGKFNRIDVKTGEFKELPAVPLRAALAPDDKTLYEVPLVEGKEPERVVAIDLATGQQRPVFTSTANRHAITLSPDGRTLALGYLSTDGKVHIARVSVDGSGFRELFTGAENLNGGTQVEWDHDGRSILFDQMQAGATLHWAVMRVPADGGEALPIFVFPRRPQWFDLSPDGSRIAYSSNESAFELWALDNVLPVLK